MPAISEILVRVGLQSTVAADGKAVEGQVRGLGQSVIQNSVAIGAATTAMGASMVLAGDAMSSAYADIRIATGATAESLEGLKGTFHDVYGAIPAEADAVAGALGNLNTLTGATGETLAGLTTNVLEVSRMLGEDGVNNAQSFGEAMKQWQIPAEEGTALMDQMFKVTQDTGIGFGELTNALNTYGPVMQNANFSTTEAAELFGELKSSGIAVSRVMPGLNKAFRDWAAAGLDGREELEKQVEAIKNAESSTEALTIATETFGAEGAQRMTVAIRNGTFELESLGEGLDDVDGLIANTAKETLTLGDKFGLLKTKTTEMLAPFEGVGYAMSAMGPAMMGIQPAMSLFSALQTGTVIPGLIAHASAAWLAIAPYLAIAAPIIAVIAVLYILEKKFGVVTKAINIITDAFDKFVGWLKGVFGGATDEAGEKTGGLGDKLLLLLGPIGAVIYAFKNFDKIKGILSNAFSGITESLAGLTDKFRDSGKNIINGFVSGIASAIEKPKEIIADAFSGIAEKIKIGDTEEVMNKLKTAALLMAGPIGGVALAFKNWDTIKTTISEATTGIRETILNSLAGTEEGITTILGGIGTRIGIDMTGWQEIVGLSFETIKNIMSGNFGEAAESVKEILLTIPTAFIDMFTQIQIIAETQIEAIKAKFSEMLMVIKQPFTDALAYVQSIPEKFRKAGEDMIEALKNGILAKKDEIVSAIRNAFGVFAQYLPSSDAQLGPLSHLTESGEAVFKTFAKGMQKSSSEVGATFAKAVSTITPTAVEGTFEKALPAAAGKEATATAGMGYGGDTITIGPVTIGSDYDVEKLYQKIQTLQASKRVQRGVRSVI